MTSPATPPGKLRIVLAEPAPELLAHFSDPRTRARLLGNVRWHGVPERRAEDIVQTTMADAWKARHAWPATLEELDRWLFKALHNDRIDDNKKDAKAPLLKKPKSEKASSDDADHDEDHQDPPPAVVTKDPAEVNDSLRFAMEYAESRPRLRHSIVWLLRASMGVSVREIAADARVREKVVTNALQRLRAELRMVHGPLLILLGFAVVAIALYVMKGRIDDSAKPGPKPVPTIVAPTPAPQEPAPLSADDLRTRAFGECDAKDWPACLADLQQAKNLDPSGDAAPRVQAALKAAIRGIEGKQ